MSGTVQPHGSFRGTGAGASGGPVALVADARLDNRADLRSVLGLDPSTDDAAILLAAWRRWGRACCERLWGDFAFAVWDGTAGELFCARDPMGVKPFYYWTGPRGEFAFASQLAPLLDGPATERRLDTTGAIHHLLYLRCDSTHTLFAGISRLAPGHALVVGAGGRPRIWRHTDLRPAPVSPPSPHEAATALRDAVVRAVADRLPGSGHVGTHVSGGLDSSAVAGVAASLLPRERLAPMSFSAATGNSVDRPFLQHFAAQVGVPVQHPPVDVVPFPDALELVAPGMLPPAYATSAAHRWASAEGVVTMLSGWGGDEAASSSGRSLLAETLRRGQARRLGAAARAVHGGRRPTVAALWATAVEPLLPDRLYWWERCARRDPAVDRLRPSVANVRMARDAGVFDCLHHPFRPRATARATQLAYLGYGHLVARMESWSADASRFGIDYCYPLLDRRVLDVALAAPPDAFMHDGTHRWLFREAMRPFLPESIASRPDKDDSWDQRSPGAFGAGAGVGFAAGWVRSECERMLREGNDLGGAVDLAKLRRWLTDGPPARYAGSPVVATLPLVGIAPAAQLAAFVRHNRMSA